MTYPQWWERLVAGIIDGIIMAVAILLVGLILGVLAFGSVTMARIMSLLATLIGTGVIVGYKVILESSSMQATVGKMVFGLKVVDGAGQRVGMQQALMRTWPWWLNLISVLTMISLTLGSVLSIVVVLALIGIFCTFFIDPVGRCIHDSTANCHVIKAGEGMIKTN